MATMENGAYEVIRQRLAQQSDELNRRLQQLNTARKDVFGALERKLLATDRITTGNHCIARDVVAVGHRCIFGYNVQLGLRSGIELSDVLNVYSFHGDHFEEEGLAFLQNADFETDFKNLYRYYKEAVFSRFTLRGAHLYMVFQLQPKSPDFKAFKWLLRPDGSIHYVDNRSEHELTAIPQYEFNWKRATRDDQRKGRHPHVSILDRIFVDTLNGTLNIKIEDNTQDGRGIYSEPVEQRDQTLDDAEFAYADLGSLIALRVKPYKEAERHYVYNEKMQEIQRIDSLASSGVLLPDDHGLIFANGYYLQTGAYKQFENIPEGLPFKRRIASPNGEDFLYVFYQADTGLYTLLFYNLIEQQVVTPITCNGFAIFPDGQLCFFRAEAEPVRHHQMQIWQTPFTAELQLQSDRSDQLLFKVGNKDIVRAMAECREIITLSGKDDAYTNLYEELSRRARNTLDAYHWLGREEAYQLGEPLKEILATAETAIEAFAGKQRREQQTREASAKVQAEAEQLFREIDRDTFGHIDTFVQALARLRGLRGAVIGLRELPYHDPELVQDLDARAAKHQEILAEACISFLLEDSALQPYRAQLIAAGGRIPELEFARDAIALDTELDAIGEGMSLLMEIVNNLKVTDATQSAQITERISSLFTELNQHKAQLRQRRQSLQRQEAEVEFGAQLKLLEQSRLHFLQQADSPEKCDEYLSRILIQLEELEGRFAEVEAFADTLNEQREGVLRAFDEQRQYLISQRNNRTTALQRAGERILQSIRQRVAHLDSEQTIQAFFAADLLVDKVRDTIQRLRDLNDSNKADALQTGLNALAQESLRQFRDRKDLYDDGQSVIRLGRHRFSVNTQSLELTTVFDGEQLLLHLTGTSFYEPLRDAVLEQTRGVWGQSLPSENEQVSRAEFLAWRLFQQAKPEWEAEAGALLPRVQSYSATRYQEGYTKGVHDEDAARILAALLQLDRSLGLLRFPPEARALAQWTWTHLLTAEEQDRFARQLQSIGRLRRTFSSEEASGTYLLQELEQALRRACEQNTLFQTDWIQAAARYLGEERSQPEPGFVLSEEANTLMQAFETLSDESLIADLEVLREQPLAQLQLVHQWLLACRNTQVPDMAEQAVLEASVYYLCRTQQLGRLVQGLATEELEGLRSEHSRMQDGRYRLDYHNFVARLQHFETNTLPAFEQFTQRRRELLAHYREELQLQEFEPQVLSSFVRNRLIDEVYLPIFGDNLAKQIGTAGADARTDRNGMLLLISPPGYGKTTLMEYLAQRLGLTFVKINGPALGHSVKSLAPEDAPSLAARKELQKLNLAFEMGDNLMLYIDDIQHCHSEFLQRFISLCDAQRKIEGVYRGRPKTYDLRGKRVCVVMAGNPYTEQGERFQIPDMLANRSDIYNLGDIIGDSEAVFRLSYIENALTANPSLKTLASRNMQDVYTLLQYLRNGEEGPLQLEGAHSPEEVQEYLSVLRKLLRIRDAVMAVNQEYIRSASMSDEYREEPPFKLQGSYRNMNKLAERVLPILNDNELQTLLLAHYEGEVQTLRSDAEANLLKLRELLGVLNDDQRKRLDSIRHTFRQNNRFRGANGNDPMALALQELTRLSEALEGIRKAVSDREK